MIGYKFMFTLSFMKRANFFQPSYMIAENKYFVNQV